jgi:hypothetical protein
VTPVGAPLRAEGSALVNSATVKVRSTTATPAVRIISGAATPAVTAITPNASKTDLRPDVRDRRGRHVRRAELNTRDFRCLRRSGLLLLSCSVSVFESGFVVPLPECGHGFVPRSGGEGARFHGPRPRRAGRWRAGISGRLSGRALSGAASLGRSGCAGRRGRRRRPRRRSLPATTWR